MPPEKNGVPNFSNFDCTKTVDFIRIILHVMGTGRFDE
jgi:hypothetical protein